MAEAINIPELVAKLGDADQAAAFKARFQIQNACLAAKDPAKKAEKAALAAALATELTAMVQPEAPKDKPNEKPAPHPKHSIKIRNVILQLLSLVGTEAEVAAITGCMSDYELREYARMALEKIPCKASAEALIKRLEKATGPEFRIGVVNTLAKFGCPMSIEAIRKMAGDSDACVRAAVVDALAKAADPANDNVIESMVKAGQVCPVHVSKARLRLAENLAGKGNKTAAKKIYAIVAADKKNAAQAKAAKMALASLK